MRPVTYIPQAGTLKFQGQAVSAKRPCPLWRTPGQGPPWEGRGGTAPSLPCTPLQGARTRPGAQSTAHGLVGFQARGLWGPDLLESQGSQGGRGGQAHWS